MKVRTAILVASLAASATASFATSVYHASPSQEEGVSLAADHLGNAVSRQAVESTVLAAQKDGSLYWISRDYPATYPLVPGPKLTKTRQQVLDELQSAKRNPSVVTVYGIWAAKLAGSMPANCPEPSQRSPATACPPKPACGCT